MDTTLLCVPGSDFYKMCQSRAINNEVMLTFANYGYFDMLLNWIHNIQEIGITNYVIASLDKQTHDELKELGEESYFYDKNQMIKYYDSSSCNFNSVEFMSICNEKPFLVNEILKAGFHCLWADNDIVFFKNPFAAFTPGLLPNSDIYFQSDDDDICAGFFYSKSNKRTTSFWDKVVEYTRNVVVLDDQSITRRFLNDPKCSIKLIAKDESNTPLSDHSLKNDKTGPVGVVENPNLEETDMISYYVLDRPSFPNGTAFFDAKLPTKLGITPYIVHNNCIIGHDGKIDRFKLYNMWFVGDKPKEFFLNKKKSAPQLPVRHNIGHGKGHIEIVTTLFSNGEVLYSASHDKTLREWDLKDCSHISSRYLNKRGGIWSMQFWDEGQTLYTGGHDKKLMSWSTKDWSQISTMSGHSGVINSLHLTVRNQQSIMFSASDDHDVFSWDLKTSQKIKIYRGHTSWVSAVTSSGPVLYTGSHDGSARAWEISTGRILQIYSGNQGWIRCLAVVGDVLYTGGSDGSVKAWAVRSGDCLYTLKQHKGGVNALAFDSTSNILYSASDDKTIIAWDTKGQQPLCQYSGHSGIVSCLALDKTALYSGSYDRTIMKWELAQ